MTATDSAVTDSPATDSAVTGVATVEAVEASRVLSLSPSRAADFMACPLLYRFRVVDRLPERPSVPATRGTVVHAVLERLFDLPAADRTPERAAALLEPEWERLLADEPDLARLFEDGETELSGFLETAVGLLERYFALEDPSRLEPAERELLVETELESGLLLRGYVDRLDRNAEGAMRVVDYKTGKAPTPGFEAKAMFQMRFYALVLWRIHGRVPRLLQLLYLGSGEVLRYEPDEADLLATERKLHALWTAIRRAADTGDWRPNPSRLCDWCDHRPLCPAHGGTPPPLPTAPLPAVPVREAGETDADRPSPRTPCDEV
ncbi:MAG TPA: PD-(D/E)XK nuclease family protein [Actinomycetes bacterium]|nr:PD-(D/E)XK nuclease family protein [Actinomycetes bacterium]